MKPVKGGSCVVYFDHSATTPIRSEVISVMTDVMQRIYGNPSSLHGLGVQSERLVGQARQVIAQILKCVPQEIVFTSGGTESNNLAIQGITKAYANRGRHLITTQIEHPSVYEVFHHLEKNGWIVTYLPVNEMGIVNPDDVERALTDETVLVSIMHVNNEMGAIQPILEIGKRLKKFPKVLFHVDAVQSFGKIPLAPHQAHVDLMSISSHKLHGPKGVGALYIRKNLLLSPILFGGGQEKGIRSGTENVPGIVGFAKAAQLMNQEQEAFISQTYMWKKELIERLQKALPQMRVNGEIEPQKGASYILNLSFAGLKSEVIVHALEKEEVYVSSKSACSSKKEEPSRVLKAIGLSDEEALGAIRISMGVSNTKEDILHLENAILRVIPELQRVMKGQKK